MERDNVGLLQLNRFNGAWLLKTMNHSAGQWLNWVH
jgi:hypothetical protein